MRRRLPKGSLWRWPLGSILAFTLLGTGCQTVYTGQVAVPNTKQRLVVGHDGGPFARIWVIEDGKAYDVKVVRGASR